MFCLKSEVKMHSRRGLAVAVTGMVLAMGIGGCGGDHQNYSYTKNDDNKTHKEEKSDDEVSDSGSDHKTGIFFGNDETGNLISGSNKTIRHDIMTVMDNRNSCVDVIYDTEAFTIPVSLDADNLSVYQVASNASASLIYVYSSDEYCSNGSLYLITGVEKYKWLSDYTADLSGSFMVGTDLAEDCTTCIVKDDSNTLFLYSGEKNIKIADDVSNAIISPDGETLVYTTIAEDDNSAVMIYTNGKSEKIAKNMTIYAVSNKGKYIYAIDDDLRLKRLDAKGNDQKLSNDVTYLGTNADRTEVMFRSNNSIYVSVKGGEKQKLFNGENFWMVNTSTDSLEQSTYASHFYLAGDAPGIFFSSEDVRDLYYVDKNYQSYKVSNSVHCAYVAADEKTVYYVADDYSIRKYNVDDDYSERLVSDLQYSGNYAFTVSEDGNEIYYLNNDNELCCFDENGTMIIEENGAAVCRVCPDREGTLFYILDADVTGWNSDICYYYQKGRDPQPFTIEVENCRMYNNEFVFVINDGSTKKYYISTSGLDFELVLTVEK